MPLDFWTPFTGKQRWSSNLRLSWCFTPTLLLRKTERLPHDFTSSGMSSLNSWYTNSGCHCDPSKFFFYLCCSLSLFSPLSPSLTVFLFPPVLFLSFGSGFDLIWLQALTVLYSPESIDQASRALSKCSKWNTSVLFLQQSLSHWWLPTYSVTGCLSWVGERVEIWWLSRQL